MPLNNLHDLITLLESHQELVRISAECDPLLEIAAITDRVCKQPDGGRALLFERPKGSAFPVTTNMFGSTRRNCLALGVESLDRLTQKMTSLLNQIPDSPHIMYLDRQISALPDFHKFSPVSGSSCRDRTMDPPNLTQFPFLHSWPGDGAAEGWPRYITLPQVFTADPDGNSPNCGMYRAQVRGAQELAIRWKTGSGAGKHLEGYRRLGKPMPVAIALGGPPAALFSAMLPLPGELDEMTFAGFLREAPIETAPCRTVPLKVPAGAEVVIEGFVEPGETVLEGPFGNHTGSYSPAGEAALMRITAINHRDGAIIPATVVGPPPMEDCWMTKAWERILLALLRNLFPWIAEIHFPLEWIFHQSAIIYLEHPLPGMVMETAPKLWELPWFSEARVLIFVDAAGRSQWSDAAWRCINLADFGRDLFHDAARNRTVLDATGSGLPRQPLETDPAMRLQLQRRWQEYGIE